MFLLPFGSVSEQIAFLKENLLYDRKVHVTDLGFSIELRQQKMRAVSDAEYDQHGTSVTHVEDHQGQPQLHTAPNPAMPDGASEDGLDDDWMFSFKKGSCDNVASMLGARQPGTSAVPCTSSSSVPMVLDGSTQQVHQQPSSQQQTTDGIVNILDNEDMMPPSDRSRPAPFIAATCSEEEDGYFVMGGVSGSDTDDTDELMARGREAVPAPRPRMAQLPASVGPHSSVTALTSVTLAESGPHDWLFSFSHPAEARAHEDTTMQPGTQHIAGAEGNGGCAPRLHPMMAHRSAVDQVASRVPMPIHPMMMTRTGQAPVAADPVSIAAHPMLVHPMVAPTSTPDLNLGLRDVPASDLSSREIPFEPSGVISQARSASSFHQGDDARQLQQQQQQRHPGQIMATLQEPVVQRVQHAGPASDQAQRRFANSLPAIRPDFDLTYMAANVQRQELPGQQAGQQPGCVAAVQLVQSSAPAGDQDEPVVQRVQHRAPPASQAAVRFANTLPGIPPDFKLTYM